jgi:hypothetical protein
MNFGIHSRALLQLKPALAPGKLEAERKHQFIGFMA